MDLFKFVYSSTYHMLLKDALANVLYNVIVSMWKLLDMSSSRFAFLFCYVRALGLCMHFACLWISAMTPSENGL